jgi:hypothetical protein
MTLSLAHTPGNLIVTDPSAEGAAHARFAVNGAFSAGGFTFNESRGVAPGLEIELRAFGVKQKP